MSRTINIFTFVISITFSSLLYAQLPIAAPGTEGNLIVVGNADPVIATFLGDTASFSNDLFLELDEFGLPGIDGDSSNDLFIFNNDSSPIGSTVDLGSFDIGTELVFRLNVLNTGNDFFTGPGARNPDGEPHARAEAEWLPNTTLVSFEDLLNGPFNFNDLSFSFTNTTTTVPEPTTSLLLLGFTGVGILTRRKRFPAIGT